MGDSNVTGNVTGNLTNVMRGFKSYNGEKPEDFSVWYKKTGFVLSMQRPDIFAVMEGQARPTDYTTFIFPAPLFTRGWLDATTGRTLEQRQTAFDRANQNLYAILYLATDKAAALLVAAHAYDGRGTRGDGQKAIKELEDKYLRVTDESIRALHATLAATTMDPDDDPDHYIMKAKQLRSMLTAVKEPINERHFTDIIVQGLPEKYHIKLTTYKDPDVDLPEIQATMRHLYLDNLSRSKGNGGLIAGRGAAMLVESGPDPNVIICKSNDKRGNGHPCISQKAGGKEVGTAEKWCSVYNTTSHNDANCYKQGAPRPKEGGVYSATVLGAHSHPTENNEKLAINFNNDFDGSFQF